jgi:hypothetical protein
MPTTQSKKLLVNLIHYYEIMEFQVTTNVRNYHQLKIQSGFPPLIVRFLNVTVFRQYPNLWQLQIFTTM